jgi:hypothetical protein
MNKLGIIIPLKSSAVSRDWKKTCEMLKVTLCSIDRQSSDSWSAVVVGNEKPQNVQLLDSERFVFHQIELQSPKLNSQAPKKIITQEIYNYIFDKTQKIIRGLQLLQNQNITHWYVMDADDILHKEFIKKTILLPNFNSQAVIINHGWIYYPKISRIVHSTHLSNLCGSTTIIPSELVKIPEYPSFHSETEWSGVPWSIYSHSEMFHYLSKEIGASNILIPSENLISYVMSYGDNCSDEFRKGRVEQLKSKVKPWIAGKHVDRTFRDHFLHPEIS